MCLLYSGHFDYQAQQNQNLKAESLDYENKQRRDDMTIPTVSTKGRFL
jgi:hypothetical protein